MHPDCYKDIEAGEEGIKSKKKKFDEGQKKVTDHFETQPPQKVTAAL